MIAAVVLAGLHSNSDGTAESKAVAAPVQDSHFAGMCSAVAAAVESCRMGSEGSCCCCSAVDMEAAAVAAGRFRTDSGHPAVDMEAASSAAGVERFRMDSGGHPVVGTRESMSSAAAAVAERFCMDSAAHPAVGTLASSSSAAVAARSTSAEIAEPELVEAAGTDFRDVLVELLAAGIPVRASDDNAAEA